MTLTTEKEFEERLATLGERKRAALDELSNAELDAERGAPGGEDRVSSAKSRLNFVVETIRKVEAERAIFKEQTEANSKTKVANERKAQLEQLKENTLAISGAMAEIRQGIAAVGNGHKKVTELLAATQELARVLPPEAQGQFLSGLPYSVKSFEFDLSCDLINNFGDIVTKRATPVGAAKRRAMDCVGKLARDVAEAFSVISNKRSVAAE